MLTLYQMPISHFCEKTRWALTYKRLPHRFKNLLPGLHARTATKLSAQTSVPVLTEGKTVVAGSAAIIDYLDREFPRFSLTPADPDESRRAREWEQWADAEIGPAVRVVAYSVLLDRPDLLQPAFAQGCAWYGKFYLNKAYPKIKFALERGLKINKQNVSDAKIKLHNAVEKQLATQGDLRPILESGFSRADLTLASLWAPLFGIQAFGINWPEDMPSAYNDFASEFAWIKPWVEHIYQAYRH